MEDEKKSYKAFYIGCGVIALVVAVIIGIVIEQHKKQESEEYIKNINALIEQRELLHQSLNQMALEYADELNEESYVILALSELKVASGKRALQCISDAGYHGLIVFSNGHTPGDNNCISVEDYKKLLDKGWEAAVGSDDKISLKMPVSVIEYEKWKKYIHNMCQEFTDKGLEVPRIYCFNEDEDLLRVKDILEEAGFDTYIDIKGNDEEGWFSPLAANVNELYGVQLDRDNHVYNMDIENNLQMVLSTTILINRVESGNKYSSKIKTTTIGEVERLVGTLQKMDGIVNVVNVSEYQEVYRKMEEKRAGMLKEYDAKKADVQKEVEAIDELIRAEYAKIK